MALRCASRNGGLQDGEDGGGRQEKKKKTGVEAREFFFFAPPPGQRPPGLWISGKSKSRHRVSLARGDSSSRTPHSFAS